MRNPTRRGLLMALGASLMARPGLAQQTGDRGIGGTGLVPASTRVPGTTPSGPGDDRGIGGTGFIGTIQRFGSIVVNDKRISYPKDAVVRIDGVRRALRDLKIGHLVRVVAAGPDEALTTTTIEVGNEVVGRIDAVSDTSLSVLGQTVALGEVKRARWMKVGARAAVSGIRRPDETIVASLVVPDRPAGGKGARRAPDRAAGTVSQDADGLWIAGLKLAGVDPALAGRRIIAAGRATGEGLVVAEAAPDIFAESVARLSLETYVVKQGDALVSGAGIVVADDGAARGLDLAGPVRVVLDAVRDAAGLRFEAIRFDRWTPGRGTGPDMPGRFGTPDRFGPGLPGRGPMGPGGALGDPGGFPGGGFGPGNAGSSGPASRGVGPGGVGPGGTGPGGLGPGGLGPGSGRPGGFGPGGMGPGGMGPGPGGMGPGPGGMGRGPGGGPR